MRLVVSKCRGIDTTGGLFCFITSKFTVTLLFNGLRVSGQFTREHNENGKRLSTAYNFFPVYKATVSQLLDNAWHYLWVNPKLFAN